MRILLSKESKIRLLNKLKEKHNVSKNKELLAKINITKSQLDKWIYNHNTYLPEKIIPEDSIGELEIVDKQEDKWGQIKGGKKTHKIILKKYGKKEIKKRQKNGGIKSAQNKDIKSQKELKININSEKFLEIYGALLGDGWLSSLSYKYKKGIWLIGISGHSEHDYEYLKYLAKIIKETLNKEPKLKYKKDSKGIEILFYSKQIIKFLNKELNFPIGLKENLEIHSTIASDWEKIKHTIRGLFDTDGCFYFDKTPAGKPYPCISIHMKAPKLLKQISEQLTKQGYKPQLTSEKIILKGSIQVNKFKTEIGSNNPKHTNKMSL